MKFELWIPIGLGAIALTVIGALAISHQQACRDFAQGNVTVGSATLTIAIADTPQEQQLGLGGCARIPERSGMYFLYDQPTQARFWMKGMLIPIDIVWIANGRVVGVESNVPAPTDHKTELLPTYSPPVPVTGVLEVEAGKAEVYGLIAGTPITIQQDTP